MTDKRMPKRITYANMIGGRRRGHAKERCVVLWGMVLVVSLRRGGGEFRSEIRMNSHPE